MSVDFFLPVRYEYADVLYLIPLGLGLAALRAKRAVLLPLAVLAGLWMTVDDVDAMGVEGSPSAMWRAATMVAAPAAAVMAAVLIWGLGPMRWWPPKRPKVSAE